MRQVNFSGRILGSSTVFKNLTPLMGRRDCKSKSEIEKETCPLAREVLREVGISARVINIISIMIIQIILRRSMGCNGFTAWFSKTTC